MNHPFDRDIADLEAIDLDFEETLTDEDAARIGGGLMATTLALGEEGGGILCISAPCPGSEGGGGFPPQPLPMDSLMTTMAIGEEGGGHYTEAWFEG